MQHLYIRVLACLCTFVLLALASTSSIFAESNNAVINNNFQRVSVSNVNMLRTTSAMSIWTSVQPSRIDDLPALLQPTNPIQEQPKQPQPKQPTASQAPQKVATQPTAVAEPGSPESNMIAFWHIRDGSAAKNSNNSWRVEIEVRLPTSYQYKFDMDYLVSIKRDKMNMEGDDIYTLRVSGMPCGTTTFAPLTVRHNELEMQSRNEFTYFEGPIFLNYNC